VADTANMDSSEQVWEKRGAHFIPFIQFFLTVLPTWSATWPGDDEVTPRSSGTRDRYQDNQ
jgi:hypothetical protein